MQTSVISCPSPNHNDRPDGCPVNMLVLHYTGMRSGDDALDRLCDPSPGDGAGRVSAHYLIDEDGLIIALVPEERRAWHAGAGVWNGIRDVNSHSIGIELVNPGHEWGYRPFPPEQLASLVTLASEIVSYYDIPVTNVIGHSDCAPARKQDPGELFPWHMMAAFGLAFFPAARRRTKRRPVNGLTARRLLQMIGYDLPSFAMPGMPVFRHAVTAFQRRFLPGHISGHLDIQTMDRLYEVGAAMMDISPQQ